MKKITIIFLLILVILLVGCGSSSSNKILGFIELNETSEEEIIKKLNLEIDAPEVWDEENGIYIITYVWHYADYSLNDVNGTIRVRFEDETAKFVNYSAEATSKNMEQLLSYLIDNYGENYENVDDYTTRWISDDLTIDYVLTDESTIEVRWYNAE